MKNIIINIWIYFQRIITIIISFIIRLIKRIITYAVEQIIGL